MTRRFTMTPNSRNSIKTPISGIKAVPFPRHSMAADEVRRRDMRMVREKGYKQQCVDGIFKFLVENGYDGQVSQKILHNPSSKDFQSIFKFLYGFIDDFVFSSRFEDEVVMVMKNLRYPYCGEITKSQLSAITPHTWPVILSMCSWLVELISHGASLLEQEEERNVESCFFEYVCDGYMRFMEGDEEDGCLEEEFERKVTEIYTGMFREIDRKKDELSRIEEMIGEAKKVSESRGELERKKRELTDDLNMLIASEKQLEGKKRKYLGAINRLTEDIIKIEEEIEGLKVQEDGLRAQITRQKINPEDVREMNEEKMELFKELERMKPEKEGLMKEVGEQEREAQERVEELEKLFFDLKGLRDEISLRIVRDVKGGARVMNEVSGEMFESGISDVVMGLEEELNGKNDVLVAAEMNKSMLEEGRSERESVSNDLNSRLKYCSDKLVMAGKLYLEKKEISESEQRKSKTEMEQLENELLKLNLESNTSLLMSEQKLQKAKIVLDRTLNSINYEREEINKMIFSFYNAVVDVHASIQSQIGDLRALLNR
ncbi:chromosome segregation protein [Encephalitozoon hellem ATCC 50504]|uniref:Kinetochore protein NDC80 n=1 Tax=Encephalitozoon hellem TaxID=27973 RepID=A0A9Q9C5L2_ENCHE|nr:chromosome segregation protein [Encephalitozoon hellem ATCC 50504]AFM99175.1 chromosome segregation protein [Encephalitozoon hellem ATCC 50504]UTX44160.1 HEC/Ndc80p-like protein [Encephalitozoon hellem]WEL39651.1 HEC/Ndc80p-like protein [Encephalitozoon hellem]|eukprot:XP_003888156.1 chromosome segregation protein [Encephalitozoon hellem ATCC 50504]